MDQARQGMRAQDFFTLISWLCLLFILFIQPELATITMRLSCSSSQPLNALSFRSVRYQCKIFRQIPCALLTLCFISLLFCIRCLTPSKILSTRTKSMVSKCCQIPSVSSACRNREACLHCTTGLHQMSLIFSCLYSTIKASWKLQASVSLNLTS